MDSDGEDPDNAKMSVYSGECHFSIKKMHQEKGDYEPRERASECVRGEFCVR